MSIQGPDRISARVERVVLFDGVCNLCNRSVDFIVRRDREGLFKFASLQSEVGKRLVSEHSLAEGDLGTMVYIERGRVFLRSTAALRIARSLPGAWPLLFGLIAVPRPVRDAVYRWTARNRYRWFGKRETCRIPSPEERERFLED